MPRPQRQGLGQIAGVKALETDTGHYCEQYRRKRDMIYEGLREAGYEVEKPGGAFRPVIMRWYSGKSARSMRNSAS